MKLFNRKPKDKIKVATAFTLKGLTKQVIQLEQKGFIKQGEIQSAMFDGTIMAYKQAMIKCNLYHLSSQQRLNIKTGVIG